MKHLEKALETFTNMDFNPHLEPYINLKDNQITFTIQDGPVKLGGINGMQVTDMLEYILYLYESLNSDFPCEENEITTSAIETALMAQSLRTRDRESRGVEGYNKA